MQPKESLEERTEMAHMHDEFLIRLDESMKHKQYVETSWLCYSIFEQRINRLILKQISRCPRPPRVNGVPVAISTRINCLKELCIHRYGGYGEFDYDLLCKIDTWCKERNALVHDLITVSKYKQFDALFESLAIEGYPLVKRLYGEATKIRNWWTKTKELDDFPEFKCKCKKKRCICDEGFEIAE